MGQLIEGFLRWLAEWADHELPQPRHWLFYPLLALLLVPVIIVVGIIGLSWYLE